MNTRVLNIHECYDAYKYSYRNILVCEGLQQVQCQLHLNFEAFFSSLSNTDKFKNENK